MDDALIKALFTMAILDALFILVASFFVPASRLPLLCLQTLVGNVLGWTIGWAIHRIAKKMGQ